MFIIDGIIEVAHQRAKEEGVPFLFGNQIACPDMSGIVR